MYIQSDVLLWAVSVVVREGKSTDQSSKHIINIFISTFEQKTEIQVFLLTYQCVTIVGIFYKNQLTFC